jgi:hypothetical protein
LLFRGDDGYAKRAEILGYTYFARVVDITFYPRVMGYAVAQLAEALRCKSEVPGFDFRWGLSNLSLT